MAIYSIYRFTNLVNGKVYIGKTVQEPLRRKKAHLRSAAKGLTNILYHSMRKHGVDNFMFEVIDQTATTPEELNCLERNYIVEYNSCVLDKNHNGYNMTRGGDGISSELMSQINLTRVADGKHPWAGPAGSKQSSKVQQARIADGTFHFQGETGRLLQQARIDAGTHPLAGDTGSNMQKKEQKKRMDARTHNFLDDDWATKLSGFNNDRIALGTHNTQIEYTCPHCLRTGKGPSMKGRHFDKCKLKP